MDAATANTFNLAAPGGATLSLGNDLPLAIIAGPCMAESADLCLEVAAALQRICGKLGLPYIFKASYDKANRSSIHTQRGPGLGGGLGILARVRAEFGVPVLTDVHETAQVAEAAAVADVLQVPAFLCRQTDLLVACAQSGRAVNVKKGQFMAPWDMQNVWDKLGEASTTAGLPRRALLTERGASFGYNNLVVDYRGLLWMKAQGIPACFDATHSAQLPGGAGTASGGQREYIPGLATAAVSLGIAALFMEVHPDPAKALSDKDTQWPLAQAEALLTRLAELDRWAKAG